MLMVKGESSMWTKKIFINAYSARKLKFSTYLSINMCVCVFLAENIANSGKLVLEKRVLDHKASKHTI